MNPAPLDPDVRRSVIEALAQRLASDYVFEPVGARMEHLLEERLEAKTYDTIPDADELARVLTGDLRTVAQDKHLNVRYRLPSSLAAPPPASTYADTGIRKVEVLDGNIGYVELEGVSLLEIAQRAVEGAFAMVQGTDALIIDNRDNTGGDPVPSPGTSVISARDRRSS